MSHTIWCMGLNLTNEELFKNSELVVYGKVVSKSKSFNEKDYGGGDQILTDYYIKPSQI